MNIKNPSCSGDGSSDCCNGCTGSGLEGKSLAMVYSPKQYWRKLYTPDEAMTHGTLFVELDKPFLEEGGGLK